MAYEHPLDEDCLFCKILRGTIPAATILQTDLAMAFLDIAPANPGHTLLIPRGHYRSLAELPQDLATELGRLLPPLARAVQQATGAEGLNVVNNYGVVAGQSVFHVHFHLIPRFSNDPIHWPWPAGQYVDDAHRDATLKKIQGLLQGQI